MTLRGAINTTFLALLMLGGLRAADAQAFRQPFRDGSTNVLNFVEDVLMSSGTRSSGSLVFRADRCRENGDLIPDELADPPAGLFSNVGDALSALARVDPRVSWRRADGMWRVRDGKVRDGLLRVRLRRVHFKDRAQAFMAVADITSTPEVRAYMRKHRLQWGMLFAATGGIGPGPVPKGSPRLSGTLRNVTVAQALDHVARFFHALWVYGECGGGPPKRIVITALQV